MGFDALPGNLARVRDEVARVQAVEGVGAPIRIVAVTKGHGLDAARAALGAGLSDLGENRVQEGSEKIASLASETARWHLIGHLQTNKAKLIPGAFAMVHSMDSVRVAEALDRAVARRAGVGRLEVLLQVNVAGEDQKSGCSPVEAPAIAAAAAALPGLELRGLMTMAPYTDDEGVQRRVFASLRRIREELEAQGLSLPELSMGMSGDFRAAVAEGATLLRLGTVLFGERPS
jgi:pyridoxal phosphate enzyme (YggS family)